MQAAGIELCAQQQAKVMAILTQARKDLLAVLTSEQQAKFAKFTQGSQFHLMPVVIGQQASLTTAAGTSTQTCSASKTAALTVAQTSICPADCQKACCGSKTETVAEQTTCPIMGSPVKQSVFTVYQGKKVYFCCPGCDKAFNKNPEKYASNLPQFK
jgi:YHS domain-containing protein